MLCWIQPCTIHRSGPSVRSATRNSPGRAGTPLRTARPCPSATSPGPEDGLDLREQLRNGRLRQPHLRLGRILHGRRIARSASRAARMMRSGRPARDGFLAVFQGGTMARRMKPAPEGPKLGRGRRGCRGRRGGSVGFARLSGRDVHPEVERPLPADLEPSLRRCERSARACPRTRGGAPDVRVVAPRRHRGLLHMVCGATPKFARASRSCAMRSGSPAMKPLRYPSCAPLRERVHDQHVLADDLKTVCGGSCTYSRRRLVADEQEAVLPGQRASFRGARAAPRPVGLCG